jgi:hypothetical protein
MLQVLITLLSVWKTSIICWRIYELNTPNFIPTHLSLIKEKEHPQVLLEFNKYRSPKK